MVTTQPALEGYLDRLHERFQALALTTEFKETRTRWLKALALRGPMRADRWAQIHRHLFKQAPTPALGGAFWDLQVDCGALAERFGLAPWVVESALFVKDFDPQEEMHFEGAFTPEQVIITPGLPVTGAQPDPLVMAARGHGFRFQAGPAGPTSDPFRAQLILPLAYPPEAAVALVRGVVVAVNDLARKVYGLPIPARQRQPRPQVACRLITHVAAPAFIAVLKHAAKRVGLAVSFEPGQPSIADPTGEPAATVAFRLAIDIPIGCSPVEAATFTRRRLRDCKAVGATLGFPVARRWRRSLLARNAAQLRVGKTLASGEVYEIIDEQAGGESGLADDRKRRVRVKTQRARVKKHLERAAGI